jgi:hypothetical protein
MSSSHLEQHGVATLLQAHGNHVLVRFGAAHAAKIMNLRAVDPHGDAIIAAD